MARSSWKPPFIPAIRRTSSEITRPGVTLGLEGRLRPRSVRIATSRVGHRIRVLSGLRAVSLLISAERVGHATGEFVPTRKMARIVRSGSKGKALPAKVAPRK